VSTKEILREICIGLSSLEFNPNSKEETPSSIKLRHVLHPWLSKLPCIVSQGLSRDCGDLPKSPDFLQETAEVVVVLEVFVSSEH